MISQIKDHEYVNDKYSTNRTDHNIIQRGDVQN